MEYNYVVMAGKCALAKIHHVNPQSLESNLSKTSKKENASSSNDDSETPRKCFQALRVTYCE